MTIDWKNNKAFALANGIVEEDSQLNYTGKEFDQVTFINFPNIYLEDMIFNECVFENCGEVAIYGCEMASCIFTNVSDINGHETDFYGCEFRNCNGTGYVLFTDGSSEIDHCIFEDCSAHGEKEYIIEQLFDSKDDVILIKRCRFINCSVENKDKELTHCECFTPLSKIKTQAIDNLDYESCTGIV